MSKIKNVISVILLIWLSISSFHVIAQEDDPCNGSPVLLSVFNSCIMDTGMAIMPNQSGFTPGPCSGVNVYDVWYQVVVPASITTLTFEINGSYGNNPVGASYIYVYRGSCPGGPTNWLGCRATLGTTLDTASLNISGLIPGETLFVRIAFNSSSIGTFGICVHSPLIAGITVISNTKLTSYYSFSDSELIVESQEEGSAEMVVYNGLGQLYLKKTLLIGGITKIPIEALPGGLYYCSVKLRGKSSCCKIFIQN